MKKSSIDDNTTIVSPRKFQRESPRRLQFNKNHRQLDDKTKKGLHVFGDDELNKKIQSGTQAVGSLIGETFDSSGSAIQNLFSRTKNFLSDFSNSQDSGNQKSKKIFLALLSGGIFIFAFKSTIDFFTGLMSGKRNNLLKLLDTSTRWILGFLTFNSFTGKGFKLNNLNQILMLSGFSAVLAQLSGINNGEKNILGSIARMTGMESTLKKMTNWYSILPADGGSGTNFKSS
jgi:hypothetical protein